jgi:UDP-N-acetylmuramate--alanine ligase
MLGHHNVQNALAAIAIAHELQIPPPLIKKALANFEGVGRRFTKTGEVNGVTIIDDYGHHPVEIAAVLKAARGALAGTTGKIIAVVQPHRYTRLRDLFADFCTCFNDADAVIVAPVYAAGEQPIEGIDRDSLTAGIGRLGHRAVMALESPAQLPELVAKLAQPGDFVICLGAGDITKWAHALPQQLEARLVAENKQRA